MAQSLDRSRSQLEYGDSGPEQADADKFINKNLISLKFVLFTFFAGLGCIYPFLPLHMIAIGLTKDESKIISIVAPCIAILGPLIAGPLADKLVVGRGNEGSRNNEGNGRKLRYLIAVCLLLAAIFYGLLLTIPSVYRFEARRPAVTFSCNPNGAIIFQECCSEEKICNHWSDEKIGSLLLSNCQYGCETSPEKFLSTNKYAFSTTENPAGTTDDDINYEDLFLDHTVEDDLSNARRKKRQIGVAAGVPPPHLCYGRDRKKVAMCEVYTEDSKQLKIDIGLLSSDSDNNNNDTDPAQWCKYQIAGHFQCNIPLGQVEMMNYYENNTCKPVINCLVDDPYDSPESVLAESQCTKQIGDPELTFWLYLFVRSIADIFPTAALCLLSTACVIATRETSLGRGDVGQQLAFGTLGLAIFPPLVGYLNQDVMPPSPPYMLPIYLFICFMIVGAIIVLCASEMPLSPPEWWWHMKCGMLAMPMNTVRRYGAEIAAVVSVLVLLGILWSALDTYIPWTVKELNGNDLLLGLTICIGAVVAIPALWGAETLVDYCGHSNLLIVAFIFYIIRFTGMSLIEDPWWALLCEAFEVFTLSLMWVTTVLYFRHLVPRKYTATGQALPVLAHFCLGRCIGAIIGAYVVNGTSLESLRCVYRAMAVCACIVGVVYLILYHLVLAPRCRAPTTGPPAQSLIQGMNSNGTANGNYTPLRVYHNERGRKGQFRY